MDIENIIKIFCSYRSISEDDIAVGNNRRINETKYMIWVYIHCEMGLSASKIAKRFNRNRPSIFRGIRIIKHQFKYHKALRAEYQSIVEKIEGMTEVTPSENMED